MNYFQPCGIVSINKEAKDDDCDNAILFTSLYLMLYEDEQTRDKFGMCLRELQIMRGCFGRRRLDSEPSSWDDHLSLTAYSFTRGWGSAAQDIFDFASRNDFVFRDSSGDRTRDKHLWRFPYFTAVVKACASVPLNPLNQLLCTCAILWDAYRYNRDEVGGRITMWIGLMALGTRYTSINISRFLWVKRMQKLFGTPRDLLSRYYPIDHPISQYSGDWF